MEPPINCLIPRDAITETENGSGIEKIPFVSEVYNHTPRSSSDKGDWIPRV